MRVLMTGGGGFLGAWIIKRLAARGLDVRVFDRNSDRRIVREIAGAVADEVDWRIGDVANADDVMSAAEGCGFIIHLAGLLTPACRENPIRGAQVNLIGTLSVFEAAKALGMRGVAYASSAGVFGPDDGATPYPTTHYGAFKLACEGSARAYWLDDGIPSVGFRPPVVYGPGREIGLSSGPSVACREAVAGRPYVIGYSGLSDMIFVDDVAAAFEAAVIRPFEGAHAFSMLGQVADVPEVVAQIRSHIPDADISWEGPPIPMHPFLKPGPMEEVLGPLPRTDLASGIARTIAHYRAVAAGANPSAGR